MERLTNRSSGMTEKRIQLLEAEDFVWDPHEAQWFERLQELKDFKMHHGDTLVPQRYPANPSLGRWVDNQRTYYMIYQKKMEFKEKWRGVEVLDDELLEAEDFVWDPLEAQWLEKLNEMKDYKLHHGDTLVPYVYPANP
ncbi:hypothetical protein ACHAW5_005554 [Stephanodiscus triporus]|uniref:Helicase-associated domain-containing protein n=1 Tax=Stephanodiscus triporus TaxID=2934178 RepID=A0ABD3N1P4_9STRA